MELYNIILPSITWMYVRFVLRAVWTITIAIILCAVAIYYSVLYYKIWKQRHPKPSEGS